MIFVIKFCAVSLDPSTSTVGRYNLGGAPVGFWTADESGTYQGADRVGKKSCSRTDSSASTNEATVSRQMYGVKESNSNPTIIQNSIRHFSHKNLNRYRYADQLVLGHVSFIINYRRSLIYTNLSRTEQCVFPVFQLCFSRSE